MSFKLNSIITIGTYRFRGVHEVVIKKSIHSFTDTCNIKIPMTCRLRMKGNLETESVLFTETQKLFKEGDKVNVKLGYNGNYNDEFNGFVRKLNYNTPLEIECEGYSYQLRKNLQPKAFSNVDYKEILKYIIEGTNIVLHPSMSSATSIPVHDFKIGSNTGAQVLELFKKHMQDVFVMFFEDNKLYVGLDMLYNNETANYVNSTNTVNYSIGWNTIKSDDLKLINPENLEVKVTLGNGKKDGTKQTISGGDATSTVEIKKRIQAIADPATLKIIANIMAGKQKYKGYEGKVEAFGLPFCQHAYRVNLTSKRYKDLEGTYLCDSMEVKYNMQGFRRYVGIGHNLSL